MGKNDLHGTSDAQDLVDMDHRRQLCRHRNPADRLGNKLQPCSWLGNRRPSRVAWSQGRSTVECSNTSAIGGIPGRRESGPSAFGGVVVMRQLTGGQRGE